MANRNPRQVSFQDRDLSQGGRLPTDMPEVIRSSGEGQAQVARSLDLFSERIGRYADDAMKVEASQQARLDVAGGTFRPDGGSTLKAQAYDATGEPLYLSKVTAQFDQDATTLYEKHKADPAGFKSAFAELRATYGRDHVFPGLQAVFDAKATRTETAFAQSALAEFNNRQKDQARASFVRDMQANETARLRALSADPNAAGIDQVIDGMAGEQLARIRSMVEAGHISAEKGAQLEIAARNDATASVVMARAGKLGSEEDVTKYRVSLREQFTKGALKIDGAEFENLDAGLAKIGKAKGVGMKAELGEFDTAISGYLERQGKGLMPSVAEMSELAMRAEKLGPAGAAKFEELRQKIAIRRLIDTVPVEKADEVLRGLKREAATGGGKAEPVEREAMAFFRARGWSPVAAAAIAGGLMAEGLRSTESRNPGDGRDGSDSIGIAQWNAERSAALKAFAASRGKDWTDRETQLAFVDKELRETEGKWGAALARAQTPEDAARAMISYFRPKGWTSANPEAGHNWEGRLANARRLSGVGLSASAAGVLEDAESYLKKRRTLIETDPLGEAERSGTIAGIAPLDWNAGDGLKAQLGTRAAQAEAVAEANGRAPQYLRPDEKDRLKEVLQAGGEKALRMATDIVEGAGSPARARAILGEIESAAPRLGVIGRMVAHGAKEQQDAARDAFEALRMEQAPGVKTAGAPKEAGTIEREVFGTAFAGQIADRQRAIDAARLIYKGRMARLGYDPEDKKGEDVYREALRLSTGGSGQQTRPVGGVQDYTPPGNYFGQRKVLAPEDVRFGRFPDVIAAMRDEDLAEVPKGAPEKDGRRYTARDFKSAYPVRVPGGYAFARGEPGSDDPQWITAKDGRPFVLDWQWFKTRVRPRVPQAFGG